MKKLALLGLSGRVFGALTGVLVWVLSSGAAEPSPAVLRLNGTPIPKAHVWPRQSLGEAKQGPPAKVKLGRLAGTVELALRKQALEEFGIKIDTEAVRRKIRSVYPPLAENPEQLVKQMRKGAEGLVRGLRMVLKEPEKEKTIYLEVVKEATGYSYDTWKAIVQSKRVEDYITATEASMPDIVDDVYKDMYPSIEQMMLRELLVDRICQDAGIGEPTDEEILAFVRSRFGKAYKMAAISPSLRKSVLRPLRKQIRAKVYRKWLQGRYNAAKIEDVHPDLAEHVRALRSHWWKGK